jgi:hypothetical protein
MQKGKKDYRKREFIEEKEEEEVVVVAAAEVEVN